MERYKKSIQKITLLLFWLYKWYKTYYIFKPFICAKKIKYIKREAWQTIIFDNHKDSHIIDITDLPIDIKDNNKYILNVVD